MSDSWQQLGLLAQRSSWERMGDRFSSRGADISLGGWLLVVLVVTLFGVGLFFLNRYNKQAENKIRYNSPRRLFRDLCRAHKLLHAQRSLLRTLSAARQLENASLLFVEPAHFEVRTLPASLRSRANEIVSLRKRLFGGLESAEQGPKGPHRRPARG